MDEKISLKAVEDYCDDFASKVTASFFASKEKITGVEILQVCEIQQVNLFVIRELMHAWKLESQKLRSPYFDYAAAPVSESLARFQNLLSNYISISRENFQPLLKKAVVQALSLILGPYDFYAETLDTQGGSLRVDNLKNDVKYVKINRIPLENLLNELEKRKLSSISGNEAFALLDHILEEVNFTPEEIDKYVQQFSLVVPLNLEKLYEQKAVGTSALKAEMTTPKITADEVTNTAVTPGPGGINKVATAHIPLYDPIAKGSSGTVAENFQKRKKIKDSLTINQKFMFTKILFNGDFELFSAAVDSLDELDSSVQAKSFLSNNYGEWNPESEEYQEFMEVIERRFA